MNISVKSMQVDTLNSVVAYQEFVLSTNKLPNHLYCFFEGKDNPYYVPRIKKFTQNYHPINCGGRSKVLEVHRLIKNQKVYNKYKKAFFIDKDFNETLALQNPIIFETPCYSIENLYVKDLVFKEILSNEFHLSETTNPLHQKYLALYKNRQKEFHQAILLFNAWYSCLISIRNEKNIPTGVQLEDKFPKGFIQISIDEVLQKYTLQDLQNKTPNALEINEEILNIKMQDFSNCDASKIFRGKYEMEFLIKFIDCMLADSKSNNETLKVSFGNPLVNQQAISLFNIYAETPEELNIYINSVIN